MRVDSAPVQIVVRVEAPRRRYSAPRQESSSALWFLALVVLGVVLFFVVTKRWPHQKSEEFDEAVVIEETENGKGIRIRKEKMAR